MCENIDNLCIIAVKEYDVVYVMKGQDFLLSESFRYKIIHLTEVKRCFRSAGEVLHLQVTMHYKLSPVYTIKIFYLYKVFDANFDSVNAA